VSLTDSARSDLTAPSPSRHIDSLDGVRGLAVLLVVSYHLGYVRSGWVGVQIFFVLSGYLITNILVHDREHFLPRQFFVRFYWRRALRIFPLYYAYLVAITAGHIITNRVAPDLPRLWPYVYFYGMDFARMQQSDQGSFWFKHLWSLAVEEQFYAIWPWVVFYLSPRSVRRIIAVVLLASPLFRLALELGLQGSPEYIGRVIYVLPVSQFSSFAAGAAIAVFPLAWIRDARRWSVASLALVVALGVANLVTSPQPMSITTFGYPPHFALHLQPAWGYSVLNLMAALMILSCVRGTPVFPWLRHWALRRIGRVSYAMYLIQIPVILAYNHLPFGASWYTGGALTLLRQCGFFAVLWILAEASYYGFERHFLLLKDLLPMRSPSATVAAPANT
jgi:peptidoglycan/LPS O-acetylase OafA/YrhL